MQLANTNLMAGQPQQQQVPITTIMIPATAASQLQSASLQIQQAAQAALATGGQPQIMVFMIPYPAPAGPQGQNQHASLAQMTAANLPPTISATPDQPSLNGTLIRHSTANSSIMSSSPHLSSQQGPPPPPQPQFPQQASLIQQVNHQQQQANLQQQFQQLNINQNIQQSPQQQIPPLHSQQAPPPPPQMINPPQALHTRALSSLSMSNSNSHSNGSGNGNGIGSAPKQEAEKFYIKTNFSYTAARNKMELSFQKGDVLHVLDTFQNNEYNLHCWLASHLNASDTDKGLIPDKNKAEELARSQCGSMHMTNGELHDTSESSLHLRNGSSGNGKVNSFLKRRVAQRSKSLCEDNWENVVFDIGTFKLPAYERVVYKHPGFCRPVVIFGPLADVARQKLLRDYPEKYSYPAGFNQSKEHPKVIRLKGIVEIVDQGKHALLDITPSAVEKLNFVNFAPIVIFMKTDSKSVIMEFRSRAAKSLDPSAREEDILRRDAKSSRKLLEQSIKLEKAWSHVFTATLNLSTMGSEMWYRKLRETIESQQSANVWMGEKKSEGKKLLAQQQQQQQQHHHQQHQAIPPLQPLPGLQTFQSLQQAPPPPPLPQMQHQYQHHPANHHFQYNSHSTSTLPLTGMSSSQSTSTIISNSTSSSNTNINKSELNLYSMQTNGIAGSSGPSRGSAFQLYSDMNQNSIYYYDLNKI